jgi:hypothetical protein
MKRIIGLAILAALMSGYAMAKKPPAAKYEAAPDVNSAGYMTAPTDNGRFFVVYTGAKGMTREQVAEYALLRAAEFTAESGQEWFAVIETKSQRVQLAAAKDDLRSRGGGFIGGPGGSSAGAGGTGNPAASPRGASDASTAGGASTGGFGGGAPPPQVMERWTPPRVPQTVIVIQMGSGEKASFPGLEKAPEIFSAKTTAADIRAKMPTP